MDRQKVIQETKDEIVKLKSEFYNFKNKHKQNEDDVELRVKFYNKKYELRRIRRKLQYLTDPQSFYPDKYYEKRIVKSRPWQKKIGKALSNEFKIMSMADFGCGIGSFVEGALEGVTIKALGLELIYNRSIKFTPKHIQEYIKYANLGEPINCGKWDCVLSIEVAEHLLEEEADIFVENIINASNRLIIISASWGDSKYHFNKKKREYWIKKFVDRGCKYIDKENEKLYELWDRAGGPAYVSYWKHLMMFNVPGDKNV